MPQLFSTAHLQGMRTAIVFVVGVATPRWGAHSEATILLAWGGLDGTSVGTGLNCRRRPDLRINGATCGPLLTSTTRDAEAEATESSSSNC